jgi:hypothetical protein
VPISVSKEITFKKTSLMKTIYHICIYITLLASTLFTTASCEDWLEVKSPTSRPTVDFFQTPVQAEQALLGIYNGLLPVPEYILLMSDGRSDDVWTEPADDKQRDYVDISVFNPNIYTAGTINSAWNAFYKIVSRSNLFLERVEKLEFNSGEDADIDVKATFMAEARFLRAYAYFELVRYFGRVPVATQSLSAAEAMSTPQSEPKDVYEEVIIPDLQYAIENMKEQAYTSSGGIAEAGRATLPAAQALLGRVCLTMAGILLNYHLRRKCWVMLSSMQRRTISTGRLTVILGNVSGLAITTTNIIFSKCNMWRKRTTEIRSYLCLYPM